MKLFGLTVRSMFCVLFLMLAGLMVNGIFSAASSIVSLFVLLLCLILAAASLFLPQLIRLIKRIWKPVVGKIALILVSFCAAVFIICTSLFSVLILSEIADNAPNDADLVIILGCQVKGTTPGIHLTQRLDAALEYLSTNTTAKILVTGGQGRGEEISEAEAMKAYLTAYGIAESRIYTECDSHSTRENMLMAKYICDENGLGNKAVIITHEFHQYRAKLLAEYFGFESTHYSAHTSFMTLPSLLVREWAAVGNDLLGTRLGIMLTD